MPYLRFVTTSRFTKLSAMGAVILATARFALADPSLPVGSTQVILPTQRHVSYPANPQGAYVASIRPTQQTFRPYSSSAGYNNPNAPYNYIPPSQWPGAGVSSGAVVSSVPGYEFGCSYDNFQSCYGYAAAVPSVYGLYFGVPSYIYVDLGAAVAIEPIVSDSSGSDSTFEPSTAPVNQTNYYVTNNYAVPTASLGTSTGHPASTTLAPDYVGAITDIQEAWQTGSTDLFRKYLPSAADKIAVSINGDYSYSIDADHFAQVTQNAFDSLQTYSFRVTDIRLETDGTVTAYATHVYSPSTAASPEQNKMYLSFTLSNKSGPWVIIAINSSTSQLLSDPVNTPSPSK